MQEKHTLTRVLGIHKENWGIYMHVGVGSIAGTQKDHHTLKKVDLYSVLSSGEIAQITGRFLKISEIKFAPISEY